MTQPLSPDPSSNHMSRFHEKAPKRVLVESADTPHRVMSAAQTIMFVLIVLLIGTILNSSSLYVRASTSDPSLGRSVAMKALRPFDLTMRAVGLTPARREARSVMGLERDDKVDTFTFAPVKTTPVPSTTTTLPVLGGKNRLSMWVIGDSLSITPGESILKFPSDKFDIKGLDGHVSTGIARPDVFNWFRRISDFVKENHPQVVVATFGANDDQSIYGSKGSIGPFGSDQWKRAYAERISSTMDFLAQQKTHLLWVAIPPVRDPVRNARYEIINSITRAAAAAHPTTVSYVETAKAFTMPDGGYNDSIPINGTMTLLRAPDGIHFTRAGGNMIANLVLEKLHTLYTF